MTFREDFPLFWIGVLGTVAFTAIYTLLRGDPWDEFVTVSSLAAVAFIVLYAAINGLP